MKRLFLYALICVAFVRLGSAASDADAVKAADEVKDARVLLSGEQNNLMIQQAKVEVLKVVLAERMKRLSDLCERKRQIVGEVQRSGDGIAYTVTGCIDKPKPAKATGVKGK